MKLFDSGFTDFPVEHFRETGLPRANLDSTPRNKFGYRGRELDDQGEINLLFIGDGWTEGVGVEYAQTFPSIVATRCSVGMKRDVREFNLGHRGKGFDYVSRVLWCALRNFTPDFVFVCFPDVDRREYFALDSRLVDYSPARAQAIEGGREKAQRVERELIGAMHKIFTLYDDPINALRNYLLIDALLAERGIDWAYSTNDSENARLHIDLLIEKGWFAADRYIGRPFGKVDEPSAAPGYPGSVSHAQFGEMIFDELREKLPRIIAAE